MANKLVYVAAPLFSEAEKKFNLTLATVLGAHFKVFLPQRDGVLLVELLATGMNLVDARKIVFDGDMAAINNSAAVLAVLDGRSIDEGVAFELGVAHSLNKVCIGLQTDNRRLLGNSNNPMIDSALRVICQSQEQALASLIQFCC